MTFYLDAYDLTSSGEYRESKSLGIKIGVDSRWSWHMTTSVSSAYVDVFMHRQRRRQRQCMHSQNIQKYHPPLGDGQQLKGPQAELNRLQANRKISSLSLSRLSYGLSH